MGELVFQRGELVLEVKDTLFEFSQFTFLRHACGAFNWSLCEVALECLMFLRPTGLSVAVDPEQLAQSFAQVPDCIDRDVAGEMHCMRCGRELRGPARGICPAHARVIRCRTATDRAVFLAIVCRVGSFCEWLSKRHHAVFIRGCRQGWMNRQGLYTRT